MGSTHGLATPTSSRYFASTLTKQTDNIGSPVMVLYMDIFLFVVDWMRCGAQDLVYALRIFRSTFPFTCLGICSWRNLKEWYCVAVGELARDWRVYPWDLLYLGGMINRPHHLNISLWVSSKCTLTKIHFTWPFGINNQRLFESGL